MDTTRYSKWGGSSEEVPGGPWGRWVHWSRRPLFLALAVLVATVLWAVILSILLSSASTERAALLDGQDLLRTNASKQTAALGALKEEVGDCHSCCSGTQAQLQTTRAELGEAQAKLMEQESALQELRERVTQGLAEAGRDREDVRTELFRALEAVRLQNSEGDGGGLGAGCEGVSGPCPSWTLAWFCVSTPEPAGPNPYPLHPLGAFPLEARDLSDPRHPADSCEPCPTSWLSFEGSCYFFSVPKTTWAAAQGHCADASAHLVIVGGLDEQGFLTRNTRGRGYWLGLRAVRHLGKVQGYQWVDGVSLSFSHWNQGEPNDAWGRENCVMMLHTGLWNDAPCDSEKDGWICEKRRNC
ncbi:C-type lectin domain family 4 member G isoform X3 [Pongo pygmaeus]|uniref:C-type lectin domain family 4 member G isoform X3 n=1 Tax=Pongo pygmaeus TaxID=9600 RepID=UPI0023E121AD|nr:C-type lectin domain family 4 member G isoform X3 [Pongo pygmaeus]